MPIWLCSEKHDEICHEGKDCPVCKVINGLESEVEDLTAQVEQLKAAEE